MDPEKDGSSGKDDHEVEAGAEIGVVGTQVGEHATQLAPIPDEEDETPDVQLRELAPPNPGRTLLPASIARAVSLATRSTSLALRMGTVLGGYGFGAAKVTTLSSLELGRGILEGILSRAGRDVVMRSRSELGKADAETILEASLESLHRTMTQIVFWTTTGFQMTSTTLSVVSETSLLLLSTLDQFFGSTDSSRAIASIITLIRREFENPATGRQGERVGVVDLVLGLSGMAYLQTWCHRLIEEEMRRLEIEEIVWDVVVLDDGERVDVHLESLYGMHRGRYGSPPGDMLDDGANGQIVATIQNHSVRDGDEAEDDDDNDDENSPEARLKRQIMRALPNDANVSITTSVATTKTITVDIAGSQAVPLAPPPGVELIEEGRTPGSSLPTTYNSSQHPVGDGISPTYRVVYRVKRNKERSTTFKKEGEIGQMGFVEQIDDDDDESEEDTNDDTGGDDIFSPSLITSVSSPPSLSSPPSPTPPPVPPKSMPNKDIPTIIRTTPPLNPARRARRPSSSASGVSRASASGSSTTTARGSRAPPVPPKAGRENTANQKRQRTPLATSSPSPSNNHSVPTSRKQPGNKRAPGRGKDEQSQSSSKSIEKKGGFRKALKAQVPNLSNLLQHRDDPIENSTITGLKSKQKLGPPATIIQKGKSGAYSSVRRPTTPTHVHVTPARGMPLVPKRDAPHAPSRSGMSQPKRPMSSGKDIQEPYARASSRASYISVHERRRDSLVSQTDTYSIHTTDDFLPVSPSVVRTEVKSGGSMSRSEREIPNNQQTGSPLRGHRRVRSLLTTPSIYTLKTNDSQTSLIPFGTHHAQSMFSDLEAMRALRRDGMVGDMFPRYHLLRNVTRYMRFASASYGSSFLKLLGIAKNTPVLRALDDTHHELRSFAHHTESDTSSILLSSFVDSQGGSDSTGSTNTGVPLVHYISLDHASKAVVLACRGTLGFEDVLADMTCDYDDLVWRGKSYKVHKGVHASARRLLYGGDGRVLFTLKQALDEFPDYGLVLTGHSLGGAVTALLGVMLSEPVVGGTHFMTSSEPHSRLLGDGGIATTTATNTVPQPNRICLPSGRPIHVFAYGPPSTMSSSLCRATRGLITSIVNGNDLVPYLSLGVLHDLQAVALAFKTDNHEAKTEVRQRIWEAFQTGVADRWYNNTTNYQEGPPPSKRARSAADDNDQWAYAALKVLRASMMSEKLMPPGEVFVVESTRVLRRDAFLFPGESNSGGSAGVRGNNNDDHLGRPATRVVLKYVRDVEKRFHEVRFGTSMLTDHNPRKYEEALDKLRAGVMGA